MKANLPVVIAFAFLTASCATLPAGASGQSTAEPFLWTGSLGSGGQLEIKGINAVIHVTPASGSTARVEAQRVARRRGNPEEVEIVVLEHSRGVTICAVPPSSGSRRNECAPGDEGRLNSRNNDVRVDFEIELPRGAAFRGRTANGGITVEGATGPVRAYSANGNIDIDGAASAIARSTNGSIRIRSAGEADARTTNGRITAEISRLDPTGDPLEFTTTNGSVSLRLPEGSDASLVARTTNGRIESDIPVTIGSAGRRRLAGQIGDGGREIHLRTTNGSIHIGTN